MKLSLSKKFALLGIFIATIVLLSSGWFIAKIYFLQSTIVHLQLETQTSRLEKTLVDTIDTANYMLQHISTQIVHNSASPQYVANILESFKTSDKEAKQVLASSLFSWVDANLQMSVSSNIGILRHKVDLSKGEYWQNTIKNAGKLQLGSPVGGYVSGQWVIPAAIGLTDNAQKYLGAIAVGIDIGTLTARLERSITLPGVSFVLLDKRDMQIVTQSHNYKHITLHSDPTLAIEKLDIANAPAAMLTHASLWNKNSLNSYYQLSQQPYILITSYDKALSDAESLQMLYSAVSMFLCVAGVLTVLLTMTRRHIISPILQLSSAADKLSRGETEILLPANNSYEINNLANQLSKIVYYTAAIKHANDSLEQRVAERTELLQDALNARHDFLNHLSHEIRTPVSSIHARSDILLELWDEFNHVELKESIQDIQRNSLRVCQLVTNLLDLSKTRAGKMIYDMQEQDVVLIAKQIVEECRPLYSQKSLQLVMENTAIHRVALCDAMRIGQVIRNLLSNACRYTPSGQVQLVVSNADMQAEDGRVVPSISVSVRDEGVGIPDGEQHKIFESFTQSSRTNTKAGGTGLGLAISLEIISAHHGQIWAENNTNGKGSLFVFLIPRLYFI